MLDGKTLAEMCLGSIKMWDDPAVRKLNPGASLPPQAIDDRAPFGRFGHELHLYELSEQEESPA